MSISANHFPEQIPSDLIERLKQGECLCLTDGSKFKVHRYNLKDADKTLDLFLNALEGMQKEPSAFSPEKKAAITNMAHLYVRNLERRHHKEMDKGLSGCRDNPYWMKIAKLDRYVVAFQLRQSENLPFSLKDRAIEKQYQTKIAQEQFQKWVGETTHEAKKKGLKTAVIEPLYAADAFFLHPEEIDFITSSYLHKQASRHNELIEVDPVTKHVKIKFEGNKTFVKDIRENFDVDSIGRTFSKDRRQRYFYCHDRGLTKFSPTSWEELPVFRRRSKPHDEDDYRVVLKSVQGKENHSWLELKDPANKYNVGFFWDDDGDGFSAGIHKQFATRKGMLHAADKHEFLGEENITKRTVFKVTKEQFETLKKQIEASQNDSAEKYFNLINLNCSSWVRKMLETIGISVSSRGVAAEVLLGTKLQPNSIWNRLPPLCWAKGSMDYVTSVLRNLFIYLLGGSKAYKDRSGKTPHPKMKVFPSFISIFNPKSGRFDHPKKMQQWQDRVEKVREKAIADAKAALQQDPSFEKRTLEDQEKVLRRKEQELKLAIPSMNEDPRVTEGAGF